MKNDNYRLNSQGSEYEEDFLDGLMEDVMGTKETPPAQEEPRVTSESNVEEKAEFTEPERRPRRSGLLSGILGVETSDEKKVEDNEVDKKKELITPSLKSDVKKDVTPKRKGLLSAFSTDVADDSNANDSEKEVVESESESSENVEKVLTSKLENENVDTGQENVEVSTDVSTSESVAGRSLLGKFAGVERVPVVELDEDPFGSKGKAMEVDRTKESTKDPFESKSSPLKKNPIADIDPFSEENKEKVIHSGSSKSESSSIEKGYSPIDLQVEEKNDSEPKYKSGVGIWEIAKDSSKEDEDLFDGMLGDIVEDEEKFPITGKNKEVIAPLEKPGMDSIVVTSDGRTLADMLTGTRSGPKSIREVVEDIKSGKKEIEVDGEKFNDDRYLQHVKRIRKEKTEQEKRIDLSMKFIQRNSNLTEQEKIIMKNLGIASEQLTKLMKSKDLTAKQKKEILGLGRYGPEKHFKGRKYKTTVGDTAMLEFLVKFKFANTRILRWLNNENQNRTWRKLNRLRDSGLAESKSIIGIPDLWGATPAGTAISGYVLNPGLRPMPKMQTISSNMGVNYLAACLWFNTINVLNLEDFPAHNRVIALQNDGRDRVQGEMLVSELEIRSSLGKEINPMSTTMRNLGDARLYDVISANVREVFEDWDASGKVGESPEFQLGNEYMWVLYPMGQLTISYHVPDLIVRRERGPNGEPRSIAVELERYEKSNDRYDKIMLAYKLDEYLYEEVVWVTPNARIARALQRAAEEVGFDRYRIVPIITKDGVYDKQDIWMI